MKLRTLFAAGVTLAVASLPVTPAAAAPSLEGYAVGTDTAADTSDSMHDILDFTVQWDLDEMYVQVNTDGSLPALNDASWEKPSAAREGRSLEVDFRLNDSELLDHYFLLVNGDGAAMYYREVTVNGESANVVDIKVCDAAPDVTGSYVLAEINPVECIGHPGKISATATLGDPADPDGIDYAIANGDGDVTEIADEVAGGYWLAGADGGVFALGESQFYGSMGGKPLNRPIVGIAAQPNNDGYTLVASDGGVFAYGTSSFQGSMGGKALNKPMVGIASTHDGAGYWTVASDGGVFAYGTAKFLGSMGGKPLNSPIVSMQATPSGNGYWLFAADGGVFAYGDAQFFGSMGGKPLNVPIADAAATLSGNGYRLVGEDGGIFNYGDATFDGSAASTDAVDYPVNSIITLRDGYVMVDHEGRAASYGKTFQFGDLENLDVIPSSEIVDTAANTNVNAPI